MGNTLFRVERRVKLEWILTCIIKLTESITFVSSRSRSPWGYLVAFRCGHWLTHCYGAGAISEMSHSFIC